MILVILLILFSLISLIYFSWNWKSDIVRSLCLVGIVLTCAIALGLVIASISTSNTLTFEKENYLQKCRGAITLQQVAECQRNLNCFNERLLYWQKKERQLWFNGAILIPDEILNITPITSSVEELTRSKLIFEE